MRGMVRKFAGNKNDYPTVSEQPLTNPTEKRRSKKF